VALRTGVFEPLTAPTAAPVTAPNAIPHVIAAPIFGQLGDAHNTLKTPKTVPAMAAPVAVPYIVCRIMG
jgi:hypothetical protein